MILAVAVTCLLCIFASIAVVAAWCVLADRDQLDQHLNNLEERQ